jgi:CTP synthase
MKYIVVTGGVISGLGKGITISSIGVLLKNAGLRVSSIKIDPYLNIDAGTMSPYEHGEVFVLDDGGEADLDLGNYERFLDVTLTRDHNITTGKVYSQVIGAERRGDYLGKTVQVIPHVTNAVQDWIEKVARIPVDGSGGAPDVCLVEVGGTVGDIESMMFLEALRQFQFRVGHENIIFVHVSLVPVMGVVGEQKTKPTQHSVKELRSVGINPDIIVCRSTDALAPSTREKLALFCQVSASHVLAVHDVPNIYHVPLLLKEQCLDELLLSHLGLPSSSTPLLAHWRDMARHVDDACTEVKIALVGKYNGLSDSYLSVLKALKHAAIACGRALVVEWINATHLEDGTAATEPELSKNTWDTLKQCHGILVPGGFGDRGVEGKIAAAKYARENKVPYLGVCLGFQVAVMEYARNVLGWAGANSEEFDTDAEHNVIVFMPEINPSQMGGTMRLGARRTLVRHFPADADIPQSSTHVERLYGVGKKDLLERHRHRYEVNPELVSKLEAGGLYFTGRDETGERMEVAELPEHVHPFFFGVQYHPEFKSRPTQPSPPFLGLMLHACGLWSDDLPVQALSAFNTVAAVRGGAGGDGGDGSGSGGEPEEAAATS